MKFRKEYDSIGSINVPVDKYWGASTQRSKKYFDIGDVLVRPKLIKSIAIIKKAAASVTYSVASGVSAIIGFANEERGDEGATTKDQGGTSWYVGATLSF